MLPDFANVFIEVVYAPIIYPSVLWIFAPAFLSIILMEIYFKKYPREGLGHHKSLENTVFLIFIAFDIVHYLTTNEVSAIKYYIAAFLIGVWMWVAILDFLHRLPTMWIFNTSSKLVVAFSAYIGIVLTKTPLLESDNVLHLLAVIISVMVWFGLIILIKKLIQYFQPKSYAEIESFLKKIEEDIAKANEQDQPK